MVEGAIGMSIRLALAFAQLAPQAVPPPAIVVTQQTPKPAEPSDDIVVSGLQDIDGSDSAVTRQTLGSGRTGAGPRASRAVFALADRFATCALGGRSVLKYLRPALDGNINSASQRFFLQRVGRVRSACAQDPAIARSGGAATLSPLYDTSYYDRGALTIKALNLYAPDLTLTKEQTGDRAVQARFNIREIPRARFRLPVDRQYFETAVCLVRLQPELAVRLVRGGSDDTVNRIEAAIVNRARVCVGNARRVYFDGSQFRMYIADAVYRWAVAAQGVDSLLPAG